MKWLLAKNKRKCVINSRGSENNLKKRLWIENAPANTTPIHSMFTPHITTFADLGSKFNSSETKTGLHLPVLPGSCKRH